MTDKEWAEFESRREQSPFRMRFHLRGREREYAAVKGREIIEQHAYEFVKKRLAPAEPANDGKQTPMKGHPVFIAQHATACCCRSCLMKWHGIGKGKPLNDEEIGYIASVIMRWIDMEMNGNC